jgi:hypothetical protein
MSTEEDAHNHREPEGAGEPSVGESRDKPMFLGDEVVWCKELRRDAVEPAGGKGANLGELLAAGFPVPPGFCVTTARRTAAPSRRLVLSTRSMKCCGMYRPMTPARPRLPRRASLRSLRTCRYQPTWLVRSWTPTACSAHLRPRFALVRPPKTCRHQCCRPAGDVLKRPRRG